MSPQYGVSLVEVNHQLGNNEACVAIKFGVVVNARFQVEGTETYCTLMSNLIE